MQINAYGKKSCFIYVLLESSIELGCMALRLCSFLPQRCLVETFWIFLWWIFVTYKVDFLSVVQLSKCDIWIPQFKKVRGANLQVNQTRIAWITSILVRYGHLEMEIRERRVPEKTHFWNLWKTVYPTSWRAKISDLTYLCMYLDMVGGWNFF